MDDEYTLVTGITGFIGSHVVERLLTENYHILAVVRNSQVRREIDEFRLKGAVFVEGHFYDDTVISTIFSRYRIGNVIHIAAVRGAGNGERDDYQTVNVQGTEVLLKHSHKNDVKRFIYCSSVGVYGTIPSELPASADTAFNGDNDYHKSKILAEIKVMEYIAKGLNAFIVRPTITYGERDNGFAYTLIKLVQKRLLILPFSDTKIHLLDVSSLAELFVQLMKVENIHHRIFNVGDETAVSMNKLVDAIYYAIYKKRYPFFLKLPDSIFKLSIMLLHFIKSDKWLVRFLLISKDWYYDISSATRELGFKPADTMSRLSSLVNESESR